MSPTPTFRTLAAALGLALALGTAAWGQDAATEDAGAPAADAATTEGGPVEPTDATDGADEAAPDASGNTSDDPNPDADPQGGEVAAGEPVFGADLPIVGAPRANAIGFQPAATELARDIHWLDGMLNWIIGGITLLVVGLLAWVVIRFNERRNPRPAAFTHNSPLEVAWTIVPIVILVFIGAFSLPVLFEQQEIPEGDLYIKVTGNQWFWTYEYLDDGVVFDSYMIGYNEGNLSPDISAQLAEAGYSDAEFRLATDTAMVVPVGATVVMTVTGADVIHSWTVPAFGVKQDAVPGRLAQLWFEAEREGVFFGQCSELCGKDHAFMPITVKVVSPEAYESWLATAQADFPAS